MLVKLPLDYALIDEMKPQDFGFIDVYYLPWKMGFRFYYDKLANSQYRWPYLRKFRYPGRINHE